MGETNFYSYLYAQSGVVAFDELAEVVELWNPDSIQWAFSSYIEDYTPPYGIKEALLDEKFYKSPEEGTNGDETYIRYDMSIPGIEGEVNADEIQSYLEEFLDKIGAENNSDNGYGAEVDVTDNERGGTNIDIYVYLKGKQVAEPKN